MCASSARKPFSSSSSLPVNRNGISAWKNGRSETPESLKLRVATAKQEMESIPEFDYVVINAQDKLEQAADQIVAIIEAEHLRVNPRKITL